MFIELYRKTEQITRQREALRRYADQLQQLSQASLAINSARSLDEVLRAVVAGRRAHHRRAPDRAPAPRSTRTAKR